VQVERFAIDAAHDANGGNNQFHHDDPPAAPSSAARPCRRIRRRG
jgi:hypothetical protein